MTISNPYAPGHPWYYLLGGKVLSPKDIRAAVTQSGYRGWRKDRLAELDAKAEPARSAGLRRLRTDVHRELRADLSRYRECARELAAHRRTAEPLCDQPVCADIHTAISLKHNHLYNDFAHLRLIDELLAKQPDLFDLS